MKLVLKYLLVITCGCVFLGFTTYFYQGYDSISVFIGFILVAFSQEISGDIEIKGNCCICNSKIKENNKGFCSPECFEKSLHERGKL